jgi:hypothetical protein
MISLSMRLFGDKVDLWHVWVQIFVDKIFIAQTYIEKNMFCDFFFMDNETKNF